MRNWGEQVSHKVPKVDSAEGSRGAKRKIRQNVLDEIGAKNGRVFDAFAGAGFMYRDVWKQAAEYTGCDLKYFRDQRLAFVSDNVRVMRAIDLTRFNIFDLDAYGSPWQQALILAARRPVASKERIGLVLTEGSVMMQRLGGMPFALGEVADFAPEAAGKPVRDASGYHGRLAGAARAQDKVLNRAIAGLAKKMACTVVKRWQAKGKKGTSMRYVGLVLSGL